MPVKFVVSRSEVNFEATYPQPNFGLFREDAGLFARLLKRLSPHGLKLSDLKMERGSGNLSELHLFFYLLDYALTVRIRLDRIEINCPFLTEENKKRVTVAAVDTLDCLRENIDGQYRTYAISLAIHGVLENQSAKSFLGKLVTPPPAAFGSTTGNAVAYYLAPSDERIASSLTFDLSLLASDGLFVRPQATWDAGRLPLEQFAERAEEFVRSALSSFGIEVP